MKFFEFHFNPGSKKDSIFDTFCFEPESREEEKLGYLYLIGQLKQVLPKNKNLLGQIVKLVKNRHYQIPFESPADNFKQGLEKANEFLAREIRKENTGWLGNLDMAVICLTPDFSINLSKTGDIKTLLLRNNEVFDIGAGLSFTPSPNKTFPNMVEGKLIQRDKLLILTPEVFETFKNQEIIQKLAEAKKPKDIKRIFKQKKKILKEIFGACLLIIPEKKGILAKKLYFPKIPLPSRSLTPFLEKILPPSPTLQEKIRKSLIAILVLAILLLLGWLIFKSH